MFLWFLWVQLAGSLGLQTAGVFRNPGPKICSEVTISTAPVAIGNLPFIDKFPSHKPAINLQVQGFPPVIDDFLSHQPSWTSKFGGFSSHVWWGYTQGPWRVVLLVPRPAPPSACPYHHRTCSCACSPWIVPGGVPFLVSAFSQSNAFWKVRFSEIITMIIQVYIKDKLHLQ